MRFGLGAEEASFSSQLLLQGQAALQANEWEPGMDPVTVEF